MGIQCEVCGESRIIKQDGVFLCQSCGVSYSLEEVRKLLQGSIQKKANSSVKNKITIQEGDVVYFGNYPFKALDETKYPIEWIVAEAKNETFLLITKYMIDLVQFNALDQPRTDIPQIVDKQNRYRFVWHNSSLREWLNTEFKDKAFSHDEQQSIIPRTILFPEDTCKVKDSDFGLEFSLTLEELPQIDDNVFLPSENEEDIPDKLNIGDEWDWKTPYALSKSQDPNYQYIQQYWNLTPPYQTDSNYAKLSGYGRLDGDRITGCYAKKYAFLRPMVLVNQQYIYNIINGYSENYYDYFIEQLNKQRENNRKEKERKEQVRQKQ